MSAFAMKFCCGPALLLAATLSACGGSNAVSAPSTAAAAGNSGTLSLANSGSAGSSATSQASANAASSTTGSATSAAPMGQTAAARLLMQGTFGASLSDLATASAQSYDNWFSAQAAIAPSLELPQLASWNSSISPAWWYNAVKGSDQLRQRAAFALSQIMVVSGVNSVLYTQGTSLASYYDLLVDNSLGNFRTLLDAVSHSPTMGIYLTFFRNDKPNTTTGVHADENYAREVMQLFTVGLWKLNQDGTQQLDGSGNPIPTYSQSDVTNLARVFTGWASAPQGHTGEQAWQYDQDYIDPMACYPAHHDTDAKTVIGAVSIPAGGTCDSDMKAALDAIFNNPNVGPFISKQLIQRLVTSNPSPAYVSRVAAIFANNGGGVRGDLLAVMKAILTDPEAVTAGTASGAGKLREPVLRLTGLWRAFSASDTSGKVAAQITGNATTDFGENAMTSPTVFNFYRPDYRRSGPLADAGLDVPEFQIANENTTVLTSNDLERQTYQYLDSAGTQHQGMDGAEPVQSGDVLLQTAGWEPLAADAGALVDKLNLVFMAGTMPTAMRTTLVNYVNSIPVTSPASRVIEGVQLLIDSPQYAIQH